MTEVSIVADERGIIEKSISILKDSLNAARDLVLLGLFVLLLTDASKINDLLAKAGFTEGSILGFQWKRQIENSSKQAMDAGQSLAQLQTQLGDYKEKLDEIQKQSSNPAVKASISQ